MLGFTEDRRLGGAAALNQAGDNHENTVFEVKRLIFKRITDATARGDIKS